ncbi:hypothetical protein ABTW24_22550 [Sphingobacterium thalpophilum]|uniref:Uncharacterized protein n=1 Tax=Sphingobacterium thalpophilum TaxID=259 RepID=A0ABV4HIN9_9SPHI
MSFFKKLSALVGFLSFLILGTSFSNDPPSGIINCTVLQVEYPQYYRNGEVTDVECPVCELTTTKEMYDVNGRFLGTLYTYELGSEPVVLKDITCQYVNDKSQKCTHTSIKVEGSTCVDHFVPCTTEEHPECLETR